MDQRFPPAPRTVDDTGIHFNLLLALMLKSMYVSGLATPSALANELKLSHSIITTLLDDAREKALVEVLGALEETSLLELRYALTGKGRDWASEALNQSQYVGPAPVTLNDFRAQVERQLVANERVRPEVLGERFSDLVLPRELIERIGPAVFSGRSILLYGPPGNGKTCMAEAIGRVFEQSIYVPYCIEVDNQIIKIFDGTVHTPVDPVESEASGSQTFLKAGEEMDQRWVRCRRPVVVTGGELTLDMLDLIFNPISKFYEAPMQLKATGGMFVIDDFGRQLTKAQDVLNRWIVPMDRRVDYLTLHTGKKFPVTFDELVMFSTNIPPEKLMDAGALRRIYYKIEIGAPTKEDYVRIFENECASHGMELPDDILPYLFDEFYANGNVPLARYHPRFIVEEVIAKCEYEGKPIRLDRSMMSEVLRNLYITHSAMQ